jgi:hypothetical protein
MAKYTLNKSHRKVAIKVSAVDAAETIDLQTDLKLADETLGATQVVNILSMSWTGAVGSKAIVSRGGTNIAILHGDSSDSIDFVDTDYVESVQNDKDIVVTVTGEMHVYILMRKQAGYVVADAQQYSTLP